METKEWTGPAGGNGAEGRFHLEVVFGGDKGKRFALEKAQVVVGRGTDADFQLDDPTVSRQHLVLERAGEEFRLRDLGTPNGTRVNGQKTAAAAVSEGTTIELGATVMMLRRGEIPVRVPSKGDRLQDTQRLPVLRGQPPEAESAPAEAGSARPAAGPPQPAGPATRDDLRRQVAPSRLVTQVMSWLVILCIVAGGMLLALTLVESMGRVMPAAANADSKKAAVGTRPRAAVPAARRETPLIEATAETAPDVALQKYKEAQKLEAAGDWAAALALVEEVAQRYPEFRPPAGGPVLGRLEHLKRLIQYSETVGRARRLLADPVVDKAALERVVGDLESVPATDGRFGEEAILLADQVKSRLKQLSLGFLKGEDGAAAPVEPVPAPAPAPAAGGSPKGGEAKGSDGAAAAGEGARPAKEDAGQHAKEASKQLREGNYAGARRSLDKARALDPKNKEIQAVEDLLSFKAAGLLKQARGEKDTAVALSLLDQVMAMAKEGSPLMSEAKRLREEISAPSPQP